MRVLEQSRLCIQCSVPHECAISRRHNQTRYVGAAPTCRPLSTSSQSVREHARHFAEVQARGANPRGSTISNTLHIVIVSIPCCERGGAGASAMPRSGNIQAQSAKPHRRIQSGCGNHFIYFVRRAKSSSQWFASPLYPVQVLGACPVSSDTREPANSLGLGTRQARGSTGVSDHFLWSVA
jgi:hypothetical protein